MEIFKKLLDKIDIKTLSIILLLIMSLILGLGWLNSDTSSKKLIDKIEKDNKEIEIEKGKLLKEIKKLDTNIEKVTKDIQEKDDKIKKLEISLKEYDRKLLQNNSELKKEKIKRSETLKKIEEMEKNPIKKEGNHLIESIKEKVN